MNAMDEARETLTGLVYAVKARVRGGQEPLHQARQFQSVVFGESGFALSSDNPCTDFTLTGTLCRRRGSCLGLTTVYACIAAALRLPMVPLLFDYHVAVAHAGISPPLHIELTRRGMVFRADGFSSQFGLTFGASNGLLTDGQFLAVHLSNRAAFVLAPGGRLGDACSALDGAIELFPEYKAAWINKSIVLLALGQIQFARKCMDRAASLGLGPGYQMVVDRLSEQIGAGRLTAMS